MTVLRYTVFFVLCGAVAGPAGAQPVPSPSPTGSPAVPPSPSPSPSPSPVPTPSLPPWPAPRVAAVEAVIDGLMERHGIPGLAAAVVAGREVRWSGAFGVADVENGVPVRASTVFRLASVSKPITATAVLQLHERGRLDLDAPLQRIIPDFPARASRPLTTRHLLAHQSGIRNWTPEEFRNTHRFATLDEALSVFAADPLAFEPGTRTLYTSFGYSVLASIIERASSVPYFEYMQTNVFDPAGMSTARADDVEALIPNRAHGYSRTPAGTLLNSSLSDVSNRVAGGGLCATAEDVARFASSLLKGSLLKRPTLETMLTRQKTRDGRTTGYGLGFMVRADPIRREVYHLGGQPRVSSVLLLLPDQGVAVVLLCNLEGVSEQLGTAAREIAAIAAR
jgi:serine beta-lactamase-like protein LACTB, mitochondrial